MPGELKRAGLLLRVFAKILDVVLIAAVAEMIPKAGFYGGLFYLLISDGLFDGRSIGKALLGLRVVSIDGMKQCSVKESVVRNAPFGLGVVLSALPWIGWIFVVLIAVGEFLILLGSREGMRLGDEIAKTMVIESERVKQTKVREE